MAASPVSPEDAREGAVYDVSFLDCCVQGHFTSELASKDYVDDLPGDPFLEYLTFANGVRARGAKLILRERVPASG